MHESGTTVLAYIFIDYRRLVIRLYLFRSTAWLTVFSEHVLMLKKPNASWVTACIPVAGEQVKKIALTATYRTTVFGTIYVGSIVIFSGHFVGTLHVVGKTTLATLVTTNCTSKF